MPVDEFATARCSDWRESGSVPDVQLKPLGRRFQLQPIKGSWIACAIFCRTEQDYW